MLKKFLKIISKQLGYKIEKIKNEKNDEKITILKPWLDKNFNKKYSVFANRTLVTQDRFFILKKILQQSIRLSGDVVECGVYKGGTAAWFTSILDKEKSSKKLLLFDTFSGMPTTDSRLDLHKEGDFSDTSILNVQKYLKNPRCRYYPGLIPKTFKGLDNIKVCFCHIDLDIYHAIISTLKFIWPRLTFGGYIVFDDYGFSTCPGARKAVDKFFQGKRSVPIYLPTGQAIVSKI